LQYFQKTLSLRKYDHLGAAISHSNLAVIYAKKEWYDQAIKSE